MLPILVGVLYILHQDFWFWRTAQPLVFGFLPVGLFYHAVFTVACAGLMALLVARAWPGHLESSDVTPDLKVGPTSRTTSRRTPGVGPTTRE